MFEIIRKKHNFLMMSRIGIAFGIKFFGAAFSFITSIIVSRTFTATGTGLYSLSNSVLSILAIVAKFGFDLALIKYVSIDYNNNLHGNIRKTLRNILSISLSVALAFSAFISLSSNSFASFFSKPDLANLLSIMVWALFPSILTQLFASVFKSIKHVLIGLCFESLAVNAALSIILLITVVLLKKSNLVFLGYSYLLASIVVACAVTLCWFNFASKMNYDMDSDYSFAPVFATALPLLLVNSTNYILSATDTLMLGLWTTTANVGVYNVAIKITMLFSMLLSAINALLGPRFAVMFANKQKKELARLIKRASRLMFLSALLICIFLAVYAESILGIWGKDFVTGTPIFYISLLGQFVVLATGPLATVLMMCGLEKLHRNNTIFCAILNVILNFILIKSIGVLGAAIATSLSLILKNFYCVYAVKKHLGIFCY